MIVTAVLGYSLIAGAAAQEPGAGHRVAAAPGQSVNATTPQERTTFMEMAKLAPEVKLPPLDAAVPARTETATFGLG